MSFLLTIIVAILVPLVLRRQHLSLSVVVLHSVFILHSHLVYQPPNIFTTLQIPISTSPDVIRSALLRHSQATSHSQPSALDGVSTRIPTDSSLPEHTEILLRHLRSPEARSVYVRSVHAQPIKFVLDSTF